MLEVYAPEDMRLVASEDPDLLGGVVKLQGQARRLRDAPDNGGGGLYRPAGAEQEEDLEITLIPYYAWNNRGISEMTVWLPRCF